MDSKVANSETRSVELLDYDDGDNHSTPLSGTAQDAKDMRRMGKTQELKVG